MDGGWIKLHRKLLENPIMEKPELLQLFIYCLLKANHEPNKIIFNNKEMVIEKGQFITGRNVMAVDLKSNPMTTYKRLKTLENLQILNIKSNNKFSIVTIVNYGIYQSVDENRNSKLNNKGTTREQQGNTNKNDKNDKNIYTAEFEKFYSEYPRPEDKRRTFNNWKTQLKTYSVDQLMLACKNYKNTKRNIDKQYVKSSANFLGREKPFEDYLDTKTNITESGYRDLTNYMPGG